eukprot:GEMP01067929.1.p1 GENE.GEMP01067929.1~~GEMP01067929.1.p1  ORF type:complete len:386 (+),score=98.14 GEMP01067929.1:63-1220(+)
MPRGNQPTLDQVSAIAAIWNTPEEKPNALQVIDAMEKSGLAAPKPTCVRGILAKLRLGKTPAEIIAGQGKGRGRKSTASTENVVDKIRSAIQKNNSTVKCSHRKLAKMTGVSKGSVRKILKSVLKVKPFKHIKMTVTTRAQQEKRKKLCEKIAKSISSGDMDPECIFFSDETWLIACPGSHNNQQNHRLLFPADMTRAQLEDKLKKERKQRAPGVMLHLTVAAIDGGVCVAPYFFPKSQSVNAESYQAMLESVTPPRVRQVMTSHPGRKWWFQQDGASAHTALSTKAFFRKHGVATFDWPATSACLNPLDYHVNSRIKEELYLTGDYDISSLAAVQASVLKVIDKFSADNAWREGLRKACLAFQRRCQLVVDQEGKGIVCRAKKQ